MAVLIANNAKSTLAAPIGALDTTLTIQSGASELFPSPTGGDYFYVTLENTAGTVREIVKVTSRTSAVFTIVRAQDGTFANIFAAGSVVELRINKASLTDSIVAAATSATAAASSATAAASSAASASSSASSASTSASTATTQASNASTSATNAASSATAANTSAIAAAAAAASGLYSNVQDKSANYTVVAGDAGDLIRVTTTSGAITITLPTISTVGDGFKIAIVKWSSDLNVVNINRSGSDTINGGTTSQIGSQYSQIIFVADLETSTWFASQTGLGATNVNVDVFSGTGSQTAYTLSADPSTKNNTNVYINGVYQAKATYSLSGTAFTFSTAPPSGTNNIEIEYATPLAIGTPSDGTVTAAKMAAGAAASNLGTGGVSTALLADASVTTIKVADANITPAKLSQPLTLGTAVASTSGTSIDFTSIPSWVKRITVMFSGVSTNGSSVVLLQLGAGSITSTGYLGAGGDIVGAAAANYTTGFGTQSAGNAAHIRHGVIKLQLLNSLSNTWVSDGTLALSNAGQIFSITGSISLGGTLDRVRITTVNGTDTFDAGSINILYE